MTKRVLTPEAAMAEARGIVAAGGGVAVLFGPERAGLGNDDVVLADAIVTVPVNPAFASLNLAQSALLMAYEWRRQGETVPPELPERAASGDVGRLLDHLTAELEAAGHRLVHGAWVEPWGQEVARLQAADGLLVGLTSTPWLREDG